MPTYKLTLEYVGTRFAGWAAQPDQRTVEGTVVDALVRVLDEQVKLTVAGRTDAGVHAWGQVASFTSDRDTTPERLQAALNGVLAHDVAALKAEVAGPGFDARSDARSRTYCYRILARNAPGPLERDRSLWWTQPLDPDALNVCATATVGRHDFTAFTPTQTDHIRFERDVIRASWQQHGPLLEFWIEADTFMRHMVRTLVGTMLEVGCGQRDVEDFVRLLEGAPRPAAGPTAEPCGLYLASVRY